VTAARAASPPDDSSRPRLVPPENGRERWLSRVGKATWMAAAAATIWSFGFTVMRASDLWWHLAAGRLIWESGAWPRADSWSFTRAGKPWILHEGAASVIFHLWAALLGVATLVWWKWTVLIAAFLLLFRVLWRLTADPLAAYLATLLAAAVGAPFFDIRPQIYSLLGYVALLRLLLLPAPWWAVPVLFAIWVNLHGAFVFGLVALGIVLPILQYQRLPSAAALWIAAFAVCLLNPCGYEAFKPTLEYAFDASSPFRTLDEWRPALQPGGIQSWLYRPAIAVLVVAAAGGVVLRLHRESRCWRVGMVLAVVTLGMSLQHRRIVPFFGISLGLLLAPVLASAFDAAGRRLAPRLDGTRAMLRLGVPGAALVLGVAWLAPYPLASARAFHYLTAEYTFPVETMDFIEANGLTGNAFAYYNWGGYVHLRTAGRLRVFVDGRADRVYDAATYRDYVRVLGRALGWRTIVELSGARYVLWPREPDVHYQELIATGRWRLLHRDAASVLLVDAAEPPPAALRPAPDSAYRRLAIASDAAERGDLAAAESEYAKALAMQPYLAPACINLARVQAMRGTADRARVTVRHCEAQFPHPGRFTALREVVGAAAP
jgi:hypothetical protein